MGRALRGDVRGLLVSPDLCPGDTVRVTEGPLRDMTGAVIRRASWGWSKTVPQFVVTIRGLERVLRADFLERAP